MDIYISYASAKNLVEPTLGIQEDPEHSEQQVDSININLVLKSSACRMKASDIV